MVVITLFVPCIASLMIIIKERGWREALTVWVGAWIVAFLVGGGVVVDDGDLGDGDGLVAKRLGRGDQLLGWEKVGRDLLGSKLRDLPVLAVETSEIAAGSGDGEDHRTGVKMIERFLFNGVNVN